MMALRSFFADQRGAMAVETALVAPVLLMLGVGSFQISEVVAKQQALQSAAAEAQQITLAKKPDTQAKLDAIKAIISATSDIPQANIAITFTYRCGILNVPQSTAGMCGAETQWTFVNIVVQDTYTPPWTAFGVGEPVPLRVQNKVQIS